MSDCARAARSHRRCERMREIGAASRLNEWRFTCSRSFARHTHTHTNTFDGRRRRQKPCASHTLAALPRHESSFHFHLPFDHTIVKSSFFFSRLEFVYLLLRRSWSRRTSAFGDLNETDANRIQLTIFFFFWWFTHFRWHPATAVLNDCDGNVERTCNGLIPQLDMADALKHRYLHMD